MAARLHCDSDIFNGLVQSARLEDYDPRSESAVLQIPEAISLHEFKTKALPALTKAFANALGVSPRIFVEKAEIEIPRAATKSNGKTTGPIHHLSVPNAPRGVSESLRLNPRYTFDTFVVGPSNRLAQAAAKAVCDAPGRAYNPLFLHGSVGLGKTHLLQAICHEILARNPKTRMRYLSCEQFVNDFVEATAAGKQSDFRRTFRGIDLLVIDDIHFLGSKEATQEEFFHTFNDLHTAGAQIVISSDSPPRDIPSL
ncbi:MAG: ATP-binding protein, partial [Planctomycetes bacterium]|nr:ATP-binding protein [Planctomycetota bacterium]